MGRGSVSKNRGGRVCGVGLRFGSDYCVMED